MASYLDYIPGALRAIDRLLAGETREEIGLLQDDLDFVQRWMGLERPLESYSERSRRRFFTAAKRGVRPGREYQRERRQRGTNVMNKWGLTEYQFRVIHKLMKKIEDSGIDIDYYHDPPVIKDFATIYGYQYLKEVFTQQIDSIEKYRKGNRGPGHDRWFDHKENRTLEKKYESSFGASAYVIKGTDPYYYYHSTR